MSNLESTPAEVVGTPGKAQNRAQVLEPRQVPLGGLRAINVRRTLPQRRRSLIGPWCFVDHYGPDRVAESGGMNVARHPHTGLATVSWLFSGEISHLDSAGHAATVRPGELNLMVAGRGISHQEISTPATSVLRGVQLWFALPEGTRHMAPTFHHFAPDAVRGDGTEIRVFIGSLAGSTSPVPTYTAPMLGAEILVERGLRMELELNPEFEHGFLLDSGELWTNGEPVPVDHLFFLPTGNSTVTLAAGDAPVRLLILGGEPLGEPILMWWNFVGRTHEEIVAFRRAWQEEIGAEPATASAARDVSPRFGTFPDGNPDPLPAPELPHGRLHARESATP